MKYVMIILFCISLLNSQNNTSIAHKIVYYTFNNELENATELIEQKLKEEPKNPKYHLLNIAKNLRYIRESTRSIEPWQKRKHVRDSLFTQLLEQNEILIEETLEDIPITIENKFFIAGIYGYIGRTYGELGSYFSAFKYGKKGKNLLEEVIEENPDYYDAYLGLGMFNYYADRLGGFIKFISSILGFSGDRELGLKYLKIAEEKGDLTTTEARIVLIDIYTNMEQDVESSIPYFKRLVKQFPKNKNFLNWYCNKMTDLDIYSDIKYIIENDSLNLIYDYNKGRYYYENGDFESSAKYFQNYLNENPDVPVVIYLNEISKFLTSGKTSFDKNTLPNNLKQRFSDITASHSESKLAFDYRAKCNKGIINTSPPHISNTYLTQMMTFYKGVYHYNKNDFENAITLFRSNEAIEYTKYSSYQYLLKCYLKETVNKDIVKDLIERIEDEDFEALEFRIRDLEKKYDL